MKGPHPMESPVLFLVFNRMDTMERVFQTIRAARPPRLYVASDGPRGDRSGEAEKVESIRSRVLSSIDWPCEVKTLFRDRNLGCGRAVSSAIDWFFQHEEQGIILEDDCIPDPTFYRYCDDLLQHYREDDRVMMVSGANFLFERAGMVRESYYFSKYQMIWGWATWRRAWIKYDFEMRGWSDNAPGDPVGTMNIRLDERQFWRRIFSKMAGPNRVNTWDFQWLYAMWRSNGLCVCPGRNLVNNIGYGADATHTTEKSLNNDMDVFRMEFPMVHPSRVRVRCMADNITCDNFFISSRRYRYWIGYPWVALRLLLDEIAHWVDRR